MKEYLMGILCAAFLVSLLLAIGGDGAGKGIRKLVGGIFLALAMFRPLGGLELPEFSLERFQADAEAVAEDGISQADSARLDIITDACEAYILSKAADLGLDPEVLVTLDSDGLPCAVTLTVSASPSERNALSGWITKELGLGKEDVKWIDPYQSSE